MKRWILMTAAGAAVLASVGCVDRQAQQQARQTEALVKDQIAVVNVQPARLETMTETVEITGDLTTGEDTQVGAKQPGKIVSVYVKEGDTVRAGQLLATLDTSSQLAQLRQAQAQIGTAQGAVNQATAALAQARRNAAVAPQQSSAAVQSAQAQLRSAQAQLKKAQAGARPEERAQAEAQVAAAKSNLATAEKELGRIERLVNEGAIAANRLDQQRSAVETARAQYENAVQTLNIMREGAREEDVIAAREAVNQAEQAVRNAQAQKQLDPLLQDQIRAAEAQVQSARAQLDAARAQVSIVQQSIDDMQIRAPFGGKVFGKPAQAGTVVGAGAPVVRLVSNEGIYFNGQVPATVVDQLQPGMEVQISVDGLANRVFSGRIASVSPIGDAVGRLFTVQVQIGSAPAGVKAGMFARGVVQLRTIQNATVVPVDAVVKRGNESFIYYVDGEVARQTPVTTGIQKGSSIQVTGVPMGAQVVIDGQQNLQDGAKVKVQASVAASSSAAVQENGS